MVSSVSAGSSDSVLALSDFTLVEMKHDAKDVHTSPTRYITTVANIYLAKTQYFHSLIQIQ